MPTDSLIVFFPFSLLSFILNLFIRQKTLHDTRRKKTILKRVFGKKNAMPTEASLDSRHSVYLMNYVH